MNTCQSCGMPMKKDPKGGGTEVDGSRSAKYCSYCYQGGAFVGGEVTVETFQAFCRQKMVEKGMPRLLAWLLTRGMKRLERWQDKRVG